MADDHRRWAAGGLMMAGDGAVRELAGQCGAAGISESYGIMVNYL
jgi:hypothetical protein